MTNRERNHNNSDLDYKHKTLFSNHFFQCHRLYITKKNYIQRIVGLQFVISVRGQYFSVLKMERTSLGQSLFSISRILFINLPTLDINLPSINIHFPDISQLLSFECPRELILKGILKILLNDEMTVHFYEMKEKIQEECKENKNIARYKYLKLLFYEMWFLEIWSSKIWLPYLSKVWHLIKVFFYLISRCF
jgi:hypothetical protein